MKGITIETNGLSQQFSSVEWLYIWCNIILMLDEMSRFIGALLLL